MLDLRAIREDPGPAREALARRGAAADLDRLLELDARRRELLPEVEGRRAEQNHASDEIAAAKRAGGDAADLIARMKDVSAEVKSMQAELAERRGRARRARRDASQPPAPRRPRRRRGRRRRPCARSATGRASTSSPRDHLDLGLEHGWIEIEKAAAASGSRFAYLLGDLVMVELALIRFAVETVRAEGFEPVVPPVLVRDGAALRHRLLPR